MEVVRLRGETPGGGVVGAGDLVWDLVVGVRAAVPMSRNGSVAGSILQRRGGTVGNTLALVGLAGGRVRGVMASGRDEAGALARGELEAEGVEARHVVEGRTIQVACQVEGASRLMVVDATGRVELGAEAMEGALADLEASEIVYTNLGLLATPAGEVLAQWAHARGAALWCSLSSSEIDAGSAALIRERGAAVVVGNAEEGEACGVEWLWERGVASVLTDAHRPIRVLGDEECWVEAPQAEVVDTTGAGDGFAAGLLLGVLQGRELPAAAGLGGLLGARMCAIPGAQHPRDEVSLRELRSLVGRG